LIITQRTNIFVTLTKIATKIVDKTITTVVTITKVPQNYKL